MDSLLSTQLIPYVAGVAVFVAVVAVLFALRNLASGRDEVVERLNRVVSRNEAFIAGPSPIERQENSSSTRFWGKVLSPLSVLARPGRVDEQSALKLKLIQAGFRGPHAVEIFLGSKIAVAPILTIGWLQLNGRQAVPVAFPMDVIIAVWLCGVAFLLPNLWVNMKRRDRQRSIERGMPDALDLLVTCVEAGQGIDQSLQRVSAELGLASPVLAAELDLTFLEVQAGIPRAESFRRLAERTGVEDLRSLSAMLIQTEMFGSSVARALRVQAEGMRIKRTQRAEEKAGMVAVKMTIPLILCILPSLIAIVVGPAVISIAKAFGLQQ